MKCCTFVAVIMTISMISSIAVAAPPATVDANSEIIARLDAILKRLDSIEQRLSKLESATAVSTDWWIDANGVMRTMSGRDIGFWGVDGMNSVAQPRR